MRKTTLLRFGFATLLLGGGMGAMFAVGCGGDDNGASPPVNTDGGPDGTTPIGDDDDSGPNPGIDSGHPSDAGDAGPVSQPAKLLLVHASPDAPAVRICVGFGDPSVDGGMAKIQPIVPAPNTPQGLPPGFGGPSAKPVSPIKDQILTIYAIPSAEISGVVPVDGGKEKTCQDLIGSNLIDGVDSGIPDGGPLTVIKLGTIPAGTLLDNTTWVLAVTGCLPGNANPVACGNPSVDGGNDYDAVKGNLKINRWQLDTTTAIDAGSIGAQFIHASSPYETALKGAFGGMPFTVGAGFGIPTVVTVDAGTSDAGDAGDAGVGDAGDAGDAAAVPVSDAGPATTVVSVPKFIETTAKFGDLAPATLASVQGVTFDGTTPFFAEGIVSTMPQIGTYFPLPLPAVQSLSWPSGVPTGAALANGQGYVFILVGSTNPAVPTYIDPLDGGASTPDGGGTFNGHKAHFLAFPTNPPVPAP